MSSNTPGSWDLDTLLEHFKVAVRFRQAYHVRRGEEVLAKALNHAIDAAEFAAAKGKQQEVLAAYHEFLDSLEDFSPESRAEFRRSVEDAGLEIPDW
ncbi:MAG: hypothetical protein AAFM91_15180 [Pseudomonadota bacterium]